jgi:murein DD-endopeptidase MepM/ murein hydrolase activator NlpD
MFMLFLLLLGCLFRSTVPVTLTAQPSADFNESGEDRHQRVKLRLESGESLASLLVRRGLDRTSAQNLIQKLRPFVNPRALPVGQEVDLVIDTEDDRVHAFEVVLAKRVVRADATADGWLVNQWALPFSSWLKVVRGRVTDDFARSLVRAGLGSEHVTQLQEIFVSDLDVLRDSQSGDAFAVIVTERFDAEGRRTLGPVSAASLRIGSENYSAFEYGDANGQPRYFDNAGIRLPRRFLAAPLQYDRISSTFDLARPDPLTGNIRRHEAIDYVAADGTPVIAVGQGVVEFADWHGGYGYRVEMNHGNGYVSSYGHLSAFGPNIAVGKPVKTGEVIGYVGGTGYSTGPHLHFEFSHDREKLDYLIARIGSGERLSGSELRRFRIARDEKIAALQDRNFQTAQLRKPASY